MPFFKYAAKRDKNERSLKAVLGHYGWHWTSVSGPGLPDAIVCKRGRLAWVEIKGPKGKLTEAQLKAFAVLRGVDSPLYILHDAEDVKIMDAEMMK